MIVLDEQLNDPELIRHLARWYKGSVVVINSLRTDTLIDDQEIASLLH